MLWGIQDVSASLEIRMDLASMICKMICEVIRILPVCGIDHNYKRPLEIILTKVCYTNASNSL